MLTVEEESSVRKDYVVLFAFWLDPFKVLFPFNVHRGFLKVSFSERLEFFQF
jgi:hypothetical protein